MALDPSKYTVKELRSEVDRVDDPGELRTALDAERDGKDRKTAKAAIERRLDQVDDGGGAAGGGEVVEARSGRSSGGTLRDTAMEDARSASSILEDRFGGDR